MRTFLTLAVVVLVVVLVASRIMVNEYAITPGDSELVNPLVAVSGLTTNAQPSKILLTDVYISQLSALQFVLDQFRSGLEIIPGSDLTEPDVSIDQVTNENYIDMYQSKQFAEYEALTTLGWKIPHKTTGEIVYGIFNGAHVPGLNVGDVIAGVNGTAITSPCSLVAALYRIPVGTTISLSVLPSTISASGNITYSHETTVKEVTAGVKANTPVSQTCANLTGTVQSFLGISFEPGYDYTFPGHISISTPYIGGPSAGLAMTLTLLNRLSGGELAGDHVIAATGTIDAAGQVGEVGGVAEKTIAVERAGGTVFIVPEANVAAARSENNGSLHIFGVATLAQALIDLRSLGGTHPQPLTAPYSLRSPS